MVKSMSCIQKMMSRSKKEVKINDKADEAIGKLFKSLN